MISWHEIDIENYLFDHPEEVGTRFLQVQKWLSRQFRVPSGIIDLFGVGKLSIAEGIFNYPVVVEIKNRSPKSEDLAQIFRYAKDIDEIMQVNDGTWEIGTTEKILIATGDVPSNVIFEANAMGITIKTFSVGITLQLSGSWGWTDKFKSEIRNEIVDLSYNPLLSGFGYSEGTLKPFEDFINGIETNEEGGSGE